MIIIINAWQDRSNFAYTRSQMQTNRMLVLSEQTLGKIL
jgi:hypothetical protein